MLSVLERQRHAITAKEEVVINGGGSYTIWNAGGISWGTNVAHTVKLLTVDRLQLFHSYRHLCPQ